jgi:hypothetical protein
MFGLLGKEFKLKKSMAFLRFEQSRGEVRGRDARSNGTYIQHYVLPHLAFARTDKGPTDTSLMRKRKVLQEEGCR